MNDEIAAFDRHVLGETRETVEFFGLGQNRALAAALLRDARQSVVVFTQDLEAPVYDDAEVLKGLKDIAINGRGLCIRILVQDAGHAMRHGNRLVELARRLTSSIEIRRPDTDDAEERDAFLVVDRTGYAHKLNPERYQGETSFHDPLRARELLKRFDDMWERAIPEIETRRLHI